MGYGCGSKMGTQTGTLESAVPLWFNIDPHAHGFGCPFGSPEKSTTVWGPSKDAYKSQSKTTNRENDTDAFGQAR